MNDRTKSVESNNLVADNLEAEYLAVANGDKKPGKLALEPLVRAVQSLRAVESMVGLMENGEWAEGSAHFKAKGCELAARLEDCITGLHNNLADAMDTAQGAHALSGAQHYVFLAVGDELLASDETWAHSKWNPTSPAFVGQPYEAWMPPVRRAGEGAIADALVTERDNLRAELRRRQAIEKGEVWYWQADGEDHPESLTCQVVIKADDLRELIGVVKPSPPDNSLVGYVRQQRDAARIGQQLSDWASHETARRMLNALAAIHEPAGTLFQHDETGRTTFVDKHDADSFEYANPRWNRVGDAALIRFYPKVRA